MRYLQELRAITVITKLSHSVITEDDGIGTQWQIE